MKNIINIICSSLFIWTIFSGCKKLVDTELPFNKITSESSFSSDKTAIAYLTGIYTSLGSSADTRQFLGLTFTAGLSADELSILPPQSDINLQAYYKNSLLAAPEYTNTTFSPWYNAYTLMYRVNLAIEGVDKSETLSPQIKKQLLGEAKFLRAFFYFYLVNFYGDIPLLTQTDYQITSKASRVSKQLVYSQIEKDLLEAQSLLSDQFLGPDLIKITSERVRPTKWAATSLLARTYLYMASSLGQNDKWNLAQIEASKVIANSSFGLPALSDAFLKNTKEAIWQIQPTSQTRNTQEGAVFLLTTEPTITNASKPFFLSDQLLKEFEVNDPRFTNWVGSVNVGTKTYYYAAKYKAGLITPINNVYGAATEYSTILRLAEIYLIRAEARAKMNDIVGSTQDLNEVRTRARGALSITILPNYPATLTQTQTLAAIYHERQIELFTEMGHRWFDIKRTGMVEQIMSNVTTLKGGTWNNNWQMYPIPLLEIQRNPSLRGQQNPGY